MPTKKTVIPSVSLLDCPAYAKAHERLLELDTKRGEVRQKIEERYQQMRHLTSDEIRRQEAAEALVCGSVASRREGRDSINASLNALGEEREVLDLACKMARENVNRERIIASREICRKVTPQHRELAGKLRAALLHLREVVIEEAAFRDMLDRNGVLCVADLIPPLLIPGIASESTGCPTERIDYWLEHELPAPAASR